MYFSNGFVYGGEPEKMLEVKVVEPLEDFKLRLRFSTDEVKVFDVKPLLGFPLYSPLKDERLFNRVYLDCGIPSWRNGEIDISPDILYEDGASEDCQGSGQGKELNHD